MKKFFKQAGFVLCIFASVIIVGSTAKNFLDNKNTAPENTETQTQIVAVVE